MDAAGVPRLLSRLRLENVRGFRSFEIDLLSGTTTEHPVPPATLVIGRNGTNKTSLLRSVAIALCDWSDSSAMLALPNGSLITSGQELAIVEATLSAIDDPKNEIVIRREIEYLNGKDRAQSPIGREDPERGVFLCGYGAARALSGTDSGRDYRILDSVIGLFDYTYRLIDPELTLRRLNDYLGEERYTSTLRGISQVLDLEDEQSVELARGGGIQIVGPTLAKPVPIDAWADGYRLTFNWIMDFYAHAMRANRIDNDGHVPGILLIDEIDQHLHPALQAQVLPRLRELLPSTQVIATTHSPLVALGVDPHELVSLVVRDREVTRAPTVDLRGFSVADILTQAELFNTDLYPAETVAKLKEYAELVQLGPDGRTEDESERLQAVARSLDVVPTYVEESGRDVGDSIAAQVVRQFGVAEGSQ